MDVTEPNAFAGLLGLVFAGAALAGSALDPDPRPETSAHAPASEPRDGNALDSS
jgi:hypothetical protein